MTRRILTVAVAAASIAAATAAPLADAQPAYAVTAIVALPTPQQPVQPVSAPERKARLTATPKPAVKPAPRPRAEVTSIGSYQTCNRTPQPCIDSGTLTLYGQPYGVNILAGHNYQGFQWLSRLPVGRRVVVASGPVAGTYRVTGHMRLNRQAGALPSFGGAALVLQSCEGSGTGFSLLARIS